MDEHVIFTGLIQPDSLREVIGQALGAASVCWESMDGTGVFDSERACIILEEVVTWIERNYHPEVISWIERNRRPE